MNTDHGGLPEMMNLQRAYQHLKHARPAGTGLDGTLVVDEIGIQIRDGNLLLGEFHIQYCDLPQCKAPAPQLCAFDDAWRALAFFCSDLLEELGERDGEGIPPAALCELLSQLGFQDATPVVQP